VEWQCLGVDLDEVMRIAPAVGRQYRCEPRPRSCGLGLKNYNLISLPVRAKRIHLPKARYDQKAAGLVERQPYWFQRAVADESHSMTFRRPAVDALKTRIDEIDATRGVDCGTVDIIKPTGKFLDLRPGGQNW